MKAIQYIFTIVFVCLTLSYFVFGIAVQNGYASSRTHSSNSWVFHSQTNVNTSASAQNANAIVTNNNNSNINTNANSNSSDNSSNNNNSSNNSSNQSQSQTQNNNQTVDIEIATPEAILANAVPIVQTSSTITQLPSTGVPIVDLFLLTSFIPMGLFIRRLSKYKLTA